MNSSIKIFIVLLSVLFGTKVYSQIVFEPDPYLQKSRIGLVDEFMKRFNGETLHPNISKKAKDSHKKICNYYLIWRSINLNKTLLS